ncbi:alpha,alpha-trehalase [Polaribacter haliotis]|uniref:Alpha,alpha-trehalase n=1 Tax=Polaribacter haliotis TaxID=1888915 RepID=A0A7L8AIH8_9FLAO|nr:trehalase family glycosidase [Polaribacter haliotis]QOD61815.1 alpha,alpha-trehalase [Polaribacter haliotis]
MSVTKKIKVGFILLSMFSLFVSCSSNKQVYIEKNHPDLPKGGLYFSKKEYVEKSIPTFVGIKDQMPSPIFDEQKEFVDLYWGAWKLAFDHFRQPQEGSGNVSNYIDEAFNERFYLWDTSFMTMFCNVAYDLVPGISSLDNFYAHQFENGEISCQLYETNGGVPEHNLNKLKRPFYSYTGWDLENKVEGYNPVTYVGREVPPPSYLTLDRLDHPITSWAELEHFKYSGNVKRLKMVYLPLVKYFEALKLYLKQGNGLYITDWASMDNSTRNPYLKGGGCGIDISSEMAMVAKDLSTIATIIGKSKEAISYQKEYKEIASKVNDLMWNERENFYYDLTLKGELVPVKTIAGFWTMLAEIPTKERAQLLVDELNNPKTFKTKHRVPTLAADQEGYHPDGGYWKGSVWAPTETMVLRGLENYGYKELAREIALNHLTSVNTVYKNTGTIWENYAASDITQGRPSRKDFVGWSGIGPILYLMEYAIGLKPNAETNTLVWNINSEQKSGCKNYKFNGVLTSLIAIPNNNKLTLKVTSDKKYTLQINHGKIAKEIIVKKGENTFQI